MANEKSSSSFANPNEDDDGEWDDEEMRYPRSSHLDDMYGGPPLPPPPFYPTPSKLLPELLSLWLWCQQAVCTYSVTRFIVLASMYPHMDQLSQVSRILRMVGS